VSYEQQPPGTTALFLLDKPETGGDTLFASQVELYNRLSPELQKRLEGLSVLHSGVEQANHSRQGNRGGIVRREPVENIHPLVR
jgi:sulfonate dioxygenase